MEQLSHYLLIDKLGAGGAAVVYKAQDRRQGRTVALKVIRAGAQKQAQFERELLASRQLQHEHIGTIEAMERLADGRVLIITPFFEGKTLDKLLVPIAFSKALDVTLQTAQGLAHAHSQGIIHCDIKPANLMLSKGHIKILDFGLARFLNQASDEGQIGTLEYMSPEAARGQALHVGSDLWSLGVVFYELLTGQSPFQAASPAAVLRNIADLRPRPVSHLRPGLPESVEVVLQTLLSKNPETRYPSAKALLSDLERLQSGQVLAQTPLPKTRRLSAQVKSTLTSLPEKPALLLGRDDELALLSLYLQDPECRLLTLQGMGGIGKTHLALWAAHEQASLAAKLFEAVHFVRLVMASEAGFVAALAQALDVEASATLEAVAQAIGKRRQLLVLDNFEHLTSRAFMLEHLLKACPHLTLLVTTRERLALAEEWVLPLYGLSYPPTLPKANEVRNFAALVFFEHQASKRDKTFDLSASLESVCMICSHLRGHPLGISLAAALLDTLDVHELPDKLLRNIQVLQEGTGRHRSLRAVFNQSYDLLSVEQQGLLASLAVFEGGFDLKAASVITGASSQQLDTLLDSSLLELSLDARYNQHPALHSFCQEKLAELDSDIRTRYQQYYLEQLKALRIMLRGAEQTRALEKLEQDLANLRFSIEQQEEVLNADMAEPFRAFYTHKGRYTEGWELFSKAKGDYAKVCAAWFALMLGNLEEAEKLAEAGLQNQDLHIELLSLNTKAGVFARQNEPHKAKELSQNALALAHRANDLSMIAACTTNLAVLEELLGNPFAAIPYYKQVLDLSEKTQNFAQMITTLNNLADLYLTRGEVDLAKSLLEKALLLSEKGNLSRMKPLLQSNFGLCLYDQGDYAHAEVAYLDAYKMLIGQNDYATAAKVQACLGQALAAQGKLKQAKEALFESIQNAWSLEYVTGTLSAVVRLAEILANEKNPLAGKLAALVYQHSSTEPSDRNLADKLAAGVTTTLSLKEAVAQLLQAKETLASS